MGTSFDCREEYPGEDLQRYHEEKNGSCAIHLVHVQRKLGQITVRSLNISDSYYHKHGPSCQ